MNQNKKGNVAWIATIIVIIAITAGVIGWLFAKRTQIQESQKITERPNTSLSQQNQTDSQTEKFLYKSSSDLILYETSSGKKQIILSSDKLIDYDLSQDGTFVAYSLREDGFDGNSDVYIKNLAAGTIVRLTEKNNIASFNPKIFPDNKKVAYVRRTYNSSTKRLSDGEIWIINSDGDVDSSKKILGDDSNFFIKESELDKVLDDNGKWTGDYFCLDKGEIDEVKIGISQISPSGSEIAYWESSWAPECSGLWQMPKFSRIDGLDFFTAKFKQQNSFVIKYNNKQEKFDWLASKIFWLKDGSFIVSNGAMPPLGGVSIYYYDKDQNKKWVIYDSVEQEEGSNFSQFFISDVKRISDNKFLLAYQLYFNQYDSKYFSSGKFVGEKYFIKELSFGENMIPENLSLGVPFAVSEGMSISNVKIVSEKFINYERKNADKTTDLYLYNLAKNEEVKVGNIDENLN